MADVGRFGARFPTVSEARAGDDFRHTSDLLVHHYAWVWIGPGGTRGWIPHIIAAFTAYSFVRTRSIGHLADRNTFIKKTSRLLRLPNIRMIAEECSFRLRDRGPKRPRLEGGGNERNDLLGCLRNIAFGLGCFCQAQGADKKFMVTQSDFVMSPEEAAKFLNEVLSPIIYECAESEAAPDALRTRIRKMLEMVKARQIYYSALPVYYPDRNLHILAKLEQYQSKPTIFLFVPELIAWRKTMSPSDFKYGVLVTLAHEMIHLELGHEQHIDSGIDPATDEAEAWGRTVIEIIRPLQAGGLAKVGYYTMCPID